MDFLFVRRVLLDPTREYAEPNACKRTSHISIIK